MTSVTIYDVEAKELEVIADDNDTSVAEIISMLIDYVGEMRKDYGLK